MSFELRDWDVEDDYDNPVTETYLPVDFAGEEVPRISYSAMDEHSSRHGDVARIFNDDGKDVLKADLGDKGLRFQQLDTGAVTVTFGTEGDYTALLYDRIVGKIKNREDMVRASARDLADQMKESGRRPSEFVESVNKEGGPLGFAETYLSQGNVDQWAIEPFSQRFELEPDQSIDDNFHNYEGETPVGDMDTEAKQERNSFWVRKYLDNSSRLLREELDAERKEISKLWLENKI